MRVLHYARMKTELNDILRIVRNLIRAGIISEVDAEKGLCRVQTGGMETTWLKLLKDSTSKNVRVSAQVCVTMDEG